MKKIFFVLTWVSILLYDNSITIAQTFTDISKQVAYYADGYHGGFYGHMPNGSFRDILNAMERYPRWKICLEIEPVSYGYLKSSDPETFTKLQRYLNDPDDSARIEIVSSSFAQPYCWNIGGESNIRQLTMGLESLHKSFPNYSVKTYSVQEPCWTSSLPAILRSLGYTGAVLKDPSTAWGGYARGINENTVLWTGPDGTSIVAVPRYESEELNKNSGGTESSSMVPEFISKCHYRCVFA